MFALAERWAHTLPAVSVRRSPWKAYAIGFLFSGVGLGVYLRSWIDFVVPTAVWLALIALSGDSGFWLGAFLGGTWGLLRTTSS